MNWKSLLKQSLSEKFYNLFFYYYYHLKRGKVPKILNLKNPTTFNEKIIWLKMNRRYPSGHLLADKVAVKEFVKNTLGDKYLIPNIAVYGSVEQIDFTALPRSFVLKANHGAAWNIICRDKSGLNIPGTKKKLNEWLRTNYYAISKERQYRDIAPKVLCETYLEDPLIDYKIFCFSGKPLFIQVDFDRFTNHTKSFYDLDWALMPFTITSPMNKNKLPKPGFLDEMLMIAEKLSTGLVFSRIDLYFHTKKVLFGEITFHHEGGFGSFIPREYDLIIGQNIKL